MSSDGTDVENEYSKVRRPPAPPIRNNSNVIYDLICSENNNYDEVPPLEGETRTTSKFKHLVSEPDYDEIPYSNTGDYAVISDVLNKPS